MSQTESFNHSGEKEDVKLGTKTSRVTAARLAAMHGQACVPVQRVCQSNVCASPT